MNNSDTIQDLCNKINAATDASGNQLDVTASVIQLSSSDYRLLLTSNDSGSAGVTYQDLTGSTLQNLGIITDAAGDKGNVAQTLQSADDIGSAFNALSSGSSVQVQGTDHAGNAVSLTYTKNAGDTVSDFIAKLNNAFNGTTTFTTDTNGNLIATDNITGTSNLAISSLSLGGTAYAMNVTQGGENGSGVLTAGSNAYYSIDGMQANSSSNSVTGFAAGTTFTLSGIAATTPVTVGLTTDTEAITTRVQQLVSDYNTLQGYITTETAIANPNDANSKTGDLAGDMSARSILDQITAALEGSYGTGNSSDPSSLAEVGMQTDPQSGTLSFNNTTFQQALADNFTGVVNLFTQSGPRTSRTLPWARARRRRSPGHTNCSRSTPRTCVSVWKAPRNGIRRTRPTATSSPFRAVLQRGFRLPRCRAPSARRRPLPIQTVSPIR